MKCKTQEKEEGHTHTHIYIYSYEYKLKYIVKKEGRKRETTKSVYVWHKEKIEHFNVVKMYFFINIFKRQIKNYRHIF